MERASPLLVLGLGAACSLGCHAGTEDPSAPAPSGTPPALLGMPERAHPPGELGRARDYSMSVEAAKDCLMEPPFLPKRGAVKVGIDVVLEGSSGLEVPVNPFYATLRDESGESYASTLAGCEPGLPPVRITRGQKARGYVTFEIPSTSRKLDLRYAPVVIGPGVEELKFTIGR